MPEPTPRPSALSDEERAKLEVRVREEVEAMRPLDAGERDLLRAALPARQVPAQTERAS